MTQNTTFIIGLCSGILFVAVFSFIAYMIRKRKENEPRYDERQKAIQGIGYKIGFLTLIFYIITNGIVCMLLDYNWASTFDMDFGGICLSLIAFAGYSIIKDAYIAFNQKPKYTIIAFGVVFVANLVSFLDNIGTSDTALMNLFCGIAFFVLFAILIIKQILNKKESE